MWTSSDRARVTSELADLYPHTIEGPHEPSVDLGVTDVELMGGGLLLLSRHPIVAYAQTLYRQCSGDDCLTNKGALHARIRRTGHPSAVHVFLTHTQAAHPTVGGTTAGARTAVRAQIRHLAAFVRGSRDVVAPAILFGDFNVDYFAHRDLYDYLVAELGGVVDVAPATTAGAALARPARARATTASCRHFMGITRRGPLRTRPGSARAAGLPVRVSRAALFAPSRDVGGRRRAVEPGPGHLRPLQDPGVHRYHDADVPRRAGDPVSPDSPAPHAVPADDERTWR